MLPMKAPHQSRFPFHPVSHSDYIITPSESLFFHHHPVPKPFLLIFPVSLRLVGIQEQGCKTQLYYWYWQMHQWDLTVIGVKCPYGGNTMDSKHLATVCECLYSWETVLCGPKNTHTEYSLSHNYSGALWSDGHKDRLVSHFTVETHLMK